MFTISFYYTLRVTNERLTEFDIFYSIWFFVAFVIWKHAQLVYLISDDHRFTDLPCLVDTCKRRRNKAHISLSSINVVVVVVFLISTEWRLSPFPTHFGCWWVRTHFFPVLDKSRIYEPIKCWISLMFARKRASKQRRKKMWNIRQAKANSHYLLHVRVRMRQMTEKD